LHFLSFDFSVDFLESSLLVFNWFCCLSMGLRGVQQAGSPGKWFKMTSVSHPVNNLCAGAFFFGVTLRNFFDSLRVFSLRNFSLRRIFIV
jgi:hypothetical protein